MGGPLSPLAAVRTSGVVAGVVVAVLWVVIALAPGPDLMGAGPPLWLAVGIFGGLGLAAARASLRQAPVVTALCGFISLVPVGVYLLFLPGLFRWIGVADLVVLVSGVAQWRLEG